MNKPWINCTCSEYQLTHVGCDCIAEREAKIVRVFKDGYASDNKAKIFVAGGLDVASEVRKQFGSFAYAYSVEPFVKVPVYGVTAEYTRAMSQKDNS